MPRSGPQRDLLNEIVYGRSFQPEPEPEPEPEPMGNRDISPWITRDNEENQSINNYMKYKRVIQVSGSDYTGFTHDIDIRYVDNLNGIIRSTKDKLKELFDKNNMEYLSREVERIEYHIHSHTFDELLVMDQFETIYVCNCS